MTYDILLDTHKENVSVLTNPNPNSKDSLQAYHQLLHRTTKTKNIYQNSKHNTIREL